MSDIDLFDKSISLKRLIEYMRDFTVYHLNASSDGKSEIKGWKEGSEDILNHISIDFLVGVVFDQLQLTHKDITRCDVFDIVVEALQEYEDEIDADLLFDIEYESWKENNN